MFLRMASKYFQLSVVFVVLCSGPCTVESGPLRAISLPSAAAAGKHVLVL